VFSHDSFDVSVESTDSIRSGDEPELRDDASGARTSDILALMDLSKDAQVSFAKLY
jgi:hypothetical protein